MEYLSIKLVLTVLHVFGVILGGGAAFVGDSIFFSSVKDASISQTELRFIKLSGKLVWLGLFVITLTGIGIFATNPEYYLGSDKFLAKMSIVAFLVLNGIFFHAIHIPRIKRHVNEHLSSSDEFMRHRPHLLISGGISSTSWLFAFVLGSLSKVPFTYLEIMILYLCFLVFAVAGAFVIGHFFIPEYKIRKK